jgi:germacradienol/geosmin synthase
MLGHVQELRDWVAGILNWHQDVRRYRDEAFEVPVRVGTLTGLGTSAARHLVS